MLVGFFRVVGIMCCNYCGFVDVLLVVNWIGVYILLFNIFFVGLVLVEVVICEGVDIVVYDEEFSVMVDCVLVEKL